MQNLCKNMISKCYLVFSIFILFVINRTILSHRLPHAITETGHRHPRAHPGKDTLHALKQLLKQDALSLHSTNEVIDFQWTNLRRKGRAVHMREQHLRSEELRMPKCSMNVKKSSHRAVVVNTNSKLSISCETEAEERENFECTADEYCEDAETPINRVWHCRTKTILKEKCAANSSGEGYSIIVVKQADGCDCRLVWKR